MNRNDAIPVLVFFGLWFVLNLLQANFTELAHDEAYYWMYSKYMAWGYFDHPPMVALLIKAGYFLIPNELGVRFMFCLLGTLTLVLTYSMTKGSPWLFIIMVPAMVLTHTHVAGFLAIPDTPLVFFTALFFFLYKRYLEKDNPGIALLLVLSIAGMFYSKYHGLLVVLFVFLSNPSLAKRKSAWMVVGLVTLAMVPHLMWQIKHSFPTLQYHLVSRSDGFVPGNILNYLYSQLLVTGPLIAPLVLYFSLSFKPGDRFERSLKFTLIGFLVFFFLSSSRDHIEAHWTAAAFVPMIIMAHVTISGREKAKKWLIGLAIPSVILILTLRAMVAFDRVPDSLRRIDEFNGWKQWAQEIKTIADGRQVAFMNKYQFASKYNFYTGDNSCAVNDAMARRNQYNIWNWEDSLAGKPVMLYGSIEPEAYIIPPTKGRHGYSMIDNYQPFNRIVTTTLLPSGAIKTKDSITVHCTLHNTAAYPILFPKSGNGSPVLSYVISDRKGSIIVPHTPAGKFNYSMIQEGGNLSLDFQIAVPEKPGRYYVYTIFWLPVAGNMGNAKPCTFTAE
jgi:hypothetical protein